MTIATILAGRTDNHVISVACDTPVRDAVRLLAEHRIGSLPVLKNDKVVGIMSERDVIYCLASDGGVMLDWPVERIMTTPAITVTKDMSALAALSQMTRKRIRHLPVLEEDRLIAMMSIGDLVAYRINKIEQEAEAMLAYIQNA